MIAIIDYGVGNLFSLACSLDYIGQKNKVTADENEIRKADKIILPGVGAFGDAMNKLNESKLIPLLCEEKKKGKPILGICLGMQMLFQKSYEFGEHNGLGFLKGGIYSLKDDLVSNGFDLKVPQMGWNGLHMEKASSLFNDLHEGAYVYFVHSFYAKECADSLIASCDYGVSVTAAVQKDNVFGTQFHPEKSGKVGLKILSNFCKM